MWYYIQAFERSAYAPVAQLDRVTDYESVGRGFESLLAYHLKSPELSRFQAFFVLLRQKLEALILHFGSFAGIVLNYTELQLKSLKKILIA